ncbi:MAG TPA: tryptophan-rich sensory protein [Crinalium sp.]|jgi:hypothetical protein
MKASTQPSSSGKGLSIATLVAILATLIVNTLSNIIPPQGANIGEIANTVLRGVQITPANYAFAIWGLIYLGLIVYGLYQLHATPRTNPGIQKADQSLIVACIAQIAWVYLFTVQQFWLSVVAILVILAALINAYLALRIGEQRVSREQRWQVHVPFSVYLGWISVATIVNIASALYVSGWTGWGLSAPIWTMIMLIIGAVIGAIVAIQRADIAFTLVFVWAYVAIALRQLDNPSIWITAIVAAIALVLSLVAGRMRQPRSI